MNNDHYSPFGFYFGKFLDGFKVVNDRRASPRGDTNDAWEVSVIVRASSLEEAYERIVEIANLDTKHYEGELGGVSVDWFFAGVTELDPVYQVTELQGDFSYVGHELVSLIDFKEDMPTKEELCS